MSYDDWETKDGNDINPSDYYIGTGRGDGVSFKSKNINDYYLINRRYINKNKLMIAYSFKSNWRLKWHVKRSNISQYGFVLREDHIFRIRYNGYTVFDYQLTPVKDKYGWYSPKVVYEYKDNSKLFLDISYLNDNDVYENKLLMTYDIILPTDYDRRIAFQAISINSLLDDINIGGTL